VNLKDSNAGVGVEVGIDRGEGAVICGEIVARAVVFFIGDGVVLGISTVLKTAHPFRSIIAIVKMISKFDIFFFILKL
jgi:sulfur relay (sulfurtransferase) DsrF/TusC family protein